jgi:phage terminase small subunit
MAMKSRQKVEGDLTDQQIRFCEEYIIDFNGTQAAIRAGYSKKTATMQASRLLTQANVSKKIEALTNKISERMIVTKERVIEELAKIGLANIQNYVDEDNEVKSLKKEVSADHAAAISGVKVTTIQFGSKEMPITKTTTQLTMNDKNTALSLLGKHFGVFEKDNDQKKVTNIVQVIKLPDNNRTKKK